ncbi:MAG: hypothetical protein MUF37_01330 [Methanoregulaceae archaeon]|jgi:hypothetical protein|nr:hypothetical protein [Methanoregulaceae archaeon]
MKKVIILIVLLLGFLLVIGCTQQNNLPRHYTNSSMGFSINYPENWEFKEVAVEKNGFVQPGVIFSPSLANNVSISVNSYRTPEKTAAGFESLMKMMMILSGVTTGTLIKTDNTTLGGLSAVTDEYLPRDSSKLSVREIIYSVRNGTGYWIIVSQKDTDTGNWDTQKETVDAIISSFKFT